MRIYCGNSLAAEIIHPGFAVADELEALEVSDAKAGKVFGMSKADLQKLRQGEFDITPEIAVGLEQLGSAEQEFWLQLQRDYDSHPKRGGARVGAGRKRKNFVSKQVRISAPPEEMKRIQAWLEAQPNTSQALAKLILKKSQAA
jgi:addiction module HigA family antidote